MDKTQWIGIIAGVLTSASMLPQLIKIIKERKAKEVSVLMLLVLSAGVGLWIVYGFYKKDMPIIVTNCFSLLVNLSTLFFRLRFGNK